MDNWGKNGKKVLANGNPDSIFVWALQCWLSCASPNWKWYFLSLSSSSLSLICSAKRARKGLHTNQHGHNHVNISTHTPTACCWCGADRRVLRLTWSLHCSMTGSVCLSLWRTTPQSRRPPHLDWFIIRIGFNARDKKSVLSFLTLLCWWTDLQPFRHLLSGYAFNVAKVFSHSNVPKSLIQHLQVAHCRLCFLLLFMAPPALICKQQQPLMTHPASPLEAIRLHRRMRSITQWSTAMC